MSDHLKPEPANVNSANAESTQAESAQQQKLSLMQAPLGTGVGRRVKHESATKHVNGAAIYVDDRLEFPNQLHVYARLSERAHARITRLDTRPC